MAEVTALRNNALPYPVYGVPYGVAFPILDADGDLVTGATGLDSEVSQNGDAFANCTNEATEIDTSSGVYYLLLTGAEMTADVVSVIVKTSSSGAKTTVLTFYPRKLVPLRAGTSAGGAAGYITLDASIKVRPGKFSQENPNAANAAIRMGMMVAGTATAIEVEERAAQVIALADDFIPGRVGKANLFSCQDVHIVIKGQWLVEEANPLFIGDLNDACAFISVPGQCATIGEVTPCLNSSNVAVMPSIWMGSSTFTEESSTISLDSTFSLWGSTVHQPDVKIS